MNDRMTTGIDIESINTAVLEVLHQVIPTRGALLSMDTKLFDENLLDSFALVQLIVRLSEKFGIDIPPATFDRSEWSTPSAIITTVAKRIEENPAPEHAL
jgi:D-alanine--poly(phosphoribitol) ligase subunit 2